MKQVKKDSVRIISRKINRFGFSRSFYHLFVIDLTGHTFTVGRVTENNLCCSVLGIEKKTLDLLSAHHFKLTKDLSDYNNPVFIEVRSHIQLRLTFIV